MLYVEVGFHCTDQSDVVGSQLEAENPELLYSTPVPLIGIQFNPFVWLMNSSSLHDSSDLGQLGDVLVSQQQGDLKRDPKIT